MKLDTDRLMRLSGIITRDEYTASVLNESKKLNEMEVVLSDEDLEALGVEDPEAADVSALSAEVVPADAEDVAEEEAAPMEDMSAEDSLEEAKLRDIIRKELVSIMQEVSENQDDKLFQNAQTQKTLAATMGFAGIGFGTSTRQPNAAVSRGPGGVQGFGGPGFMNAKK